MTRTFRDYRLSSASSLTADGDWFARSLLVRDEAPFTEERLREHLAAVHARLADRVADLVARTSPPTRRQERELRFMLDELIETLHRLDALAGDPAVVS